MKKKLFILINVVLILMIFTSCNKSPVTPKIQTTEYTEQTNPQPIVETTMEPKGEILSFDEAQDLLIDWCDLNQVTYMPDKNKQEYGIKLYGFLVDYSDGRAEWLGDTYCYAWVNSFTKIINFEEAGYSESTNTSLYSNLPDITFPIPISDGVVIPYDCFSPPDYVWGVTYEYEDKSVMESYQTQLKNLGFVNYGTVQSVESLWQYERENDRVIFTVEMFSEGEMFSMNMYVNY